MTQVAATDFIHTPADAPEVISRAVCTANFCMRQAELIDQQDKEALRVLKKRATREKKAFALAWKKLKGQLADKQEWADVLQEGEQALDDVAESCESYLQALEPYDGPSVAEIDAMLDAVIAEAAAEQAVAQ